MSLTRRSFSLLPAALAAVLVTVVSSCGGKESTGPADGGPAGGQTATKLAFLASLSGVTAGVAITPAVTVAVQDASGTTVSSATPSVTIAVATNPAGGTLAGSLTVSAVGGVATFSSLSIDKAGTGYTLRATSTGLAAATSASFDVIAPVPALDFPSTLGTRWLYVDTTSSGWCATWSCGSGGSRDTVLYVLDSLVMVGGRSALMLRGFPIAGAGNTSQMVISVSAGGLSKWDGSAWNTLLSGTLSAWNSDMCWSRSHDSQASVTRGSGQVTVPAGSYDVVTTSYSHHESGSPYTVYNLTESCSDYYAHGVGLVRSNHYYSTHDVGDNSMYNNGQVSLLGFNAGAPSFSREAEPNDTTTTAATVTAGTLGAVVEGSASPTDTAAIVNDVNVNPDTTGIRRIQDWYRISVTARTALAVRLVPEDADADFDVYVFSGATPTVVAFSAQQAGMRETINYTPAASGTAWIGVQNWNRKAGNRFYWLYVK